jgi:DNA repair ATPase RecN
MTVKVHIQNFQSIKDATIEIKGLTVVTGHNGAGKTAMMRAIRGVYLNSPGHKFIRHGETQCDVDVDFTDGHKVHWTKSKKKPPVYTITDGDKVYKDLKPGRGVPDEIHATGVRSIRAGNKDIWPQFSAQMKGVVFLLDKSGAVLAEAVADVKRVGQLNDAMRLAEKDLRAARDTLKIRRKDEKALEVELETFAGLEEVAKRVEALAVERQDLDKILRVLQVFTKLRARYVEVASDITFLSAIEKVEIPDGDQEISVLGKDLVELGGLASRYADTTEAIQKLSAIEEVEIPDGDQGLPDIIKELRELVSLRIRRDKAAVQVAKFQGFTDLPELEEGNLLKIERVIGTLHSLQKRYNTCRDQVTDLEEQLEINWRSDLQLKQILEEQAVVETCPTCGSVVGG